MPPLPLPSSFVKTIPLTPATFKNCRACSSPFCPVTASTTSNVSCGAPSTSRAATRFIFLSSAIKFDLLCSRPAVSTISTSDPRAFAAFSESNSTAAGSVPCFCWINGTPVRSAQIASWSDAAARKVSAAQISTSLPSALIRCASFPIVVVLPTPLTPTIIMTYGATLSGTVNSDAMPCRSEACRIVNSSVLIDVLSASRSLICFRAMPRRTVSRISSVVGTPISAAKKTSSSCPTTSSSICLRPAKTVSSFSDSESRVAETARRKRAENSCSSAASCACNSSTERLSPSTDVWTGDRDGTTSSLTVAAGGSTGAVAGGGGGGGGGGGSGTASAGSFKRRETNSSFFLRQKIPM